MEKVNDTRYDGFRNFCKQINKTNIQFFRKNNYFKGVVENVNKHYGNEYHKLIVDNYSEYLSKIDWRKIEKLSNLGDPQTEKYVFNNETYNFSNTIMRYILFTFNIISHIKNNTNLNKLNIIEIGGGFGFQPILLYELSSIFNLDIEQYTIVDLLEVCNLQNTFISECQSTCGVKYNNLNSQTYNDLEFNETYNFVISNYALGELNTYWQDTYIKNIVSEIDHGYFCWNFSPANPKIHSYFENLDIIKEEENPQTNTPPIKSYIIRY